MRILTRTQYDAICDIVMEQKKRIEELEADLEKRKAQVKELEESIKKKDECLAYANDKLYERNKEISRLRQKLNENGLTWTATGIDFPATQKPENKLF